MFMDHMTILQLIFVSLPDAILLAALGISLTGFKISLKQLLLIGIFQTIASFVIRSLTIPFGLHTILLLLVFIFIIHSVTRFNYTISSLTGLIGFTALAIIEAILVPLLLKITYHPFDKVLAQPIMRIYFFLPEAIVLLIIIFLCLRYKINILSYWKRKILISDFSISHDKYLLDDNSPIREYFPLIILVLCSILLSVLLFIVFIIPCSSDYTSSLHLHFYTVLIFSGLVILFLVFLSKILLEKINKIIEIEISSKQTSKTILLLDGLVYSIRKQRHDFNHHLQTVYGLLETASCLEARDYIRKIFFNIISYGEIIKTDIREVSAMFYTKVSLAEEKKINLEIIVNCSLKYLPLNIWEINSVLGNLIDNAIEATENRMEENSFVTVELNRNSTEYSFEITNRGEPINPAIISEIFKPSFSTKIGRSGLGLAIVEEIISNHNGNVNVFSDYEKTIFIVHLPALN